MAIIKSSTPYAKALFDLAQEKNILEEIKTDISLIKTVLVQNGALKDFLSNPTFDETKIKNLLSNVFGKSINSNTLQFLNVLVAKHRIGQLDSICDSFHQLYNISLNVSEVRLTTAVAISDEMKQQIASQYIKSNSTQIENIVDPTILGGYIMEFENKILDNSISNKLNKIKNKFV